MSAHVIRIWEKRYRAVEPERTETNRRLYSEHDIERLALLRELTHAGHGIGSIATLQTETLRELAASTHSGNQIVPVSAGADGASGLLAECVAAVKALNAPALEGALKRGELQLGSQGLLQKVIGPLAQQIGDLWREGTITAAHEHFASAVIRLFLGHAAKPFAGADGAPVVVIATPTGQLHELGALLAGAAAANVGWHVTYLGASLPAAEIAGAARQNQARAVALSIVYPEDDSRIEGELVRLRELLPSEVPILIGGRAMPAYQSAVDKIGALPMNDLLQLSFTLDELRKPARRTAK